MATSYNYERFLEEKEYINEEKVTEQNTKYSKNLDILFLDNFCVERRWDKKVYVLRNIEWIRENQVYLKIRRYHLEECNILSLEGILPAKE